MMHDKLRSATWWNTGITTGVLVHAGITDKWEFRISSERLVINMVDAMSGVGTEQWYSIMETFWVTGKLGKLYREPTSQNFIYKIFWDAPFDLIMSNDHEYVQHGDF